MTLCILLAYEMTTMVDSNTGKKLLATFPTSPWIVVARFCCGVILHMQLLYELSSGMNNMKFALNHDYRFESPNYAFLAGFMQAFSIFMIEFVNFIVILTSNTYLNVVMNFMALAIIAVFDDAFFSDLTNEKLREIIDNPDFENLYMITRTTSQNVSKSGGNVLRDDTIPPYLLEKQKAEKGKKG